MSTIRSSVRVFAVLSLVVSLTLCFKEKYYKFNDKELEFLAYQEGQVLKFSDTSNVVNELVQVDSSRDFFQMSGWFGTSYQESFEVSYNPIGNGELMLNIDLKTEEGSFGGGFFMKINDYHVYANPNTL
ncbi:hypothetical protein [Rufibacter ruber]|uniref:hypothetical protein n=1 Tax=Rufibacter ruber TaxID=1783499 RepID=UPI00082F62E5|nr:hypothetical protein [Rufibacter ruber]